MTKKSTTRASIEAETAELLEEANELLLASTTLAGEGTISAQEILDDAEIDADNEKPHSVVDRKYKLRYKQRAKELGLKRKWQKRSNNDWLATQLAGEVLDKHSKINVAAMAAILIANGVEEPSVLDEHGQFVPSESRWDSQSKGWEGRYRMSGGMALRTVVAEAGKLLLADGEELEAPAEWVAKILR